MSCHSSDVDCPALTCINTGIHSSLSSAGRQRVLVEAYAAVGNSQHVWVWQEWRRSRDGGEQGQRRWTVTGFEREEQINKESVRQGFTSQNEVTAGWCSLMDRLFGATAFTCRCPRLCVCATNLSRPPSELPADLCALNVTAAKRFCHRMKEVK